MSAATTPACTIRYGRRHDWRTTCRLILTRAFSQQSSSQVSLQERKCKEPESIRWHVGEQFGPMSPERDATHCFLSNSSSGRHVGRTDFRGSLAGLTHRRRRRRRQLGHLPRSDIGAELTEVARRSEEKSPDTVLARRCPDERDSARHWHSGRRTCL